MKRERASGRWTNWDATSLTSELRVQREVIATITREAHNRYVYTIANSEVTGVSHGLYAAQRKVRAIIRAQGREVCRGTC
jgi:hypothetical protein